MLILVSLLAFVTVMFWLGAEAAIPPAAVLKHKRKIVTAKESGS